MPVNGSKHPWGMSVQLPDGTTIHGTGINQEAATKELKQALSGYIGQRTQQAEAASRILETLK